ncbi:ABC transporter substrate-binding protein [Bordetella pseudohinzii]|uniref:Branched-chain amino acid ABC transporter substrate-binding protein n=1 Tax=Bordetella pseudohinzii TaxID=1331258 RepID=A0A0J6C962_9BORD|nr:ABC transporter substrate-binding protein [Bordetella pseudohinzii]ANY15440.1 branched-chain amino acid ABC transporter substrate-binding protein [Bordetella pseudohinzii]KMM27246.1 branched-chain amino acid ABC transporter substrate-binding protein [Bordetella pseudohinzii]KXA79449.1 branched-chain amino acid ABC transporter substrate-binding protein [Bordetella pseudohinzii]KXA82567.1 branched-chain amino acid ABC transporter substrate-binding protein [Bordetella pseudohinzii]CUI85445.1 L
MRKHFGLSAVAAALALGLPLLASAQVKVGVTVASTGPAASLGIPERNTVALLPKEVAGQKIEWIVLDDATDTTQAVKNSRKLASEDKVDVLVGTSVTPGSLAMVDVAAETKVPMISVAASAKIVEPVDDKRRWVFKTPQNDALMASALADAMVKSKVKTLGFIGFADAYGDGWLAVMEAAAKAKGIQITSIEKYSRTDTSVTGQVLKLVGAKPDAILIAGAGTPSALPQKELKARNYGGLIFQTHGAANNDVLRVCGKDCEGMLLPAGPLLVAAQLPDSNPVKKSALEYVQTYEKAHGAGSVNTFGGHMWDAGQLIVAAIPEAVKSGAKPGTPEFRAALRDALENVKNLAVSQGVFNMSPTDHAGFDERSRVMVKVKDGKWTYQPDL